MENDKVFDLLTKMYGEMNNRFDNLESDVNSLKSDVNSLKSDVSSLKSDVNSLKSDVSKIGAKIDGEIIPKQIATLDGYSVNTEKLTELTEGLEDLKVDVNNISIKTLKSENKIIEIGKTVFSR